MQLDPCRTSVFSSSISLVIEVTEGVSSVSRPNVICHVCHTKVLPPVSLTMQGISSSR